jgi:hypothetical protein
MAVCIKKKREEHDEPTNVVNPILRQTNTSGGEWRELSWWESLG